MVLGNQSTMIEHSLAREQRQHDLNLFALQREQDLNISREQHQQNQKDHPR